MKYQCHNDIFFRSSSRGRDDGLRGRAARTALLACTCSYIAGAVWVKWESYTVRYFFSIPLPVQYLSCVAPA